MTLEAALADLLDLARSSSEFTRDRVLSVVMSHVAELGLDDQDARQRLADAFTERSPAVIRTARIQWIIVHGKKPTE